MCPGMQRDEFDVSHADETDSEAGSSVVSFCSDGSSTFDSRSFPATASGSTTPSSLQSDGGGGGGDDDDITELEPAYLGPLSDHYRTLQEQPHTGELFDDRVLEDYSRNRSHSSTASPPDYESSLTR